MVSDGMQSSRNSPGGCPVGSPLHSHPCEKVRCKIMIGDVAVRDWRSQIRLHFHIAPKSIHALILLPMQALEGAGGGGLV